MYDTYVDDGHMISTMVCEAHVGLTKVVRDGLVICLPEPYMLSDLAIRHGQTRARLKALEAQIDIVKETVGAAEERVEEMTDKVQAYADRLAHSRRTHQELINRVALLRQECFSYGEGYDDEMDEMMGDPESVVHYAGERIKELEGQIQGLKDALAAGVPVMVLRKMIVEEVSLQEALGEMARAPLPSAPYPDPYKPESEAPAGQLVRVDLDQPGLTQIQFTISRDGRTVSWQRQPESCQAARKMIAALQEEVGNPADIHTIKQALLDWMAAHCAKGREAESPPETEGEAPFAQFGALARELAWQEAVASVSLDKGRGETHPIEEEE